MALLWGTVTDQPINAERLREMIREPGCGGLCVFEGRVRDEQDGRKVVSLAYESYRPMAEKLLFQLLDEASRRFGLQAAVVAHRVGELDLEDVAVWIAAASPHRAEAFAGCRWLIDEVKLRLPVWKKETYEDGESAWVQGCSTPTQDSHAHSH